MDSSAKEKIENLRQDVKSFIENKLPPIKSEDAAKEALSDSRPYYIRVSENKVNSNFITKADEGSTKGEFGNGDLIVEQLNANSKLETTLEVDGTKRVFKNRTPLPFSVNAGNMGSMSLMQIYDSSPNKIGFCVNPLLESDYTHYKNLRIRCKKLMETENLLAEDKPALEKILNDLKQITRMKHITSQSGSRPVIESTIKEIKDGIFRYYNDLYNLYQDYESTDEIFNQSGLKEIDKKFGNISSKLNLYGEKKYCLYELEKKLQTFIDTKKFNKEEINKLEIEMNNFVTEGKSRKNILQQDWVDELIRDLNEAREFIDESLLQNPSNIFKKIFGNEKVRIKFFGGTGFVIKPKDKEYVNNKTKYELGQSSDIVEAGVIIGSYHRGCCFFLLLDRERFSLNAYTSIDAIKKDTEMAKSTIYNILDRAIQATEINGNIILPCILDYKRASAIMAMHDLKSDEAKQLLTSSSSKEVSPILTLDEYNSLVDKWNECVKKFEITAKETTQEKSIYINPYSKESGSTSNTPEWQTKESEKCITYRRGDLFI